ncbi:uncharacterized protein LOC142238777 [Haematobia irritans]|uniref:uncharacterized protein LOC142238777 n=1 Tax=Haematobia irritans TaxID=7368 RepID=UPI003F50747B
MIFSNETIKLILIIVNCFNIVCALIHIAVILFFNYENQSDVHSMIMNYINMVLSGICSAAAFVESVIVVEIVATVFLSGIVTTTIIWIYVKAFCYYTLTAMILNGLISGIAFLLVHRLRKVDLVNKIAAITSPAMVPLNPLNHC